MEMCKYYYLQDIMSNVVVCGFLEVTQHNFKKVKK